MEKEKVREYINERGDLTKIIVRENGIFNEDGSPAELPKLDYKIKDREERIKRVELITEIAPPEKLTKTYLERMGDYIIAAMTKEEKKSKEIITNNRKFTIDKRESSFDEMVERFENGEDGVYSLVIKDKGAFLTQKNQITEEDLAKNPYLREWRESIKEVEEQAKRATGKEKGILMSQLISMRKDQYIIRDGGISQSSNKGNSKQYIPINIRIDEEITMDEEKEPHSNASVTLFNEEHVGAILCNYIQIKQSVSTKYESSMYYIILELDELIEKLDPVYKEILKLKTEGYQNFEIQDIVEQKFGVRHSVEYISSLWRNKIPYTLSEMAKEKYILWYYSNSEEGYWKVCSRCGKTKLAHRRFFSKNNTSKDGWYSICKECRNTPKTKATQYIKK